MPKEKNGAYVGGNVYGGCFKSGTIIGDVLINLQSDMLAGKTRTNWRSRTNCWSRLPNIPHSTFTVPDTVWKATSTESQT